LNYNLRQLFAIFQAVLGLWPFIPLGSAIGQKTLRDPKASFGDRSPQTQHMKALGATPNVYKLTAVVHANFEPTQRGVGIRAQDLVATLGAVKGVLLVLS